MAYVMRRENMRPSRRQSQRGPRLSSPKSSRDERRTALLSSLKKVEYTPNTVQTFTPDIVQIDIDRDFAVTLFFAAQLSGHDPAKQRHRIIRDRARS
jgi:hypothetical protein